MRIENYQDATPWLQRQLDTFERLRRSGLVDKAIDGNQSVENIANRIVALAESQL